jgi:hypothetical protein
MTASPNASKAVDVPSDDDLVRRGDVFAAVQDALEWNGEALGIRAALHTRLVDVPKSDTMARLTAEQDAIVFKGSDLSAGFGWSGFKVCGSKESVKAVRTAVNTADFEARRSAALLDRLKAAEARAQAAEAKLAKAVEALTAIAYASGLKDPQQRARSTLSNIKEG